jgi:hypothetical protein
MTSGKSFIQSFSCQFFDKLTSYPSVVLMKIVTRMNVDVFEYKLLVIPSTQDNHKSLYVVVGLHNVLNCDKTTVTVITLALSTWKLESKSLIKV